MDLGPGAQLTIEEGVCIRDGCAIRCNGRMTVGAGSFLNAGALFECHGEIQIGERVLISPQVHLYDFDHGTLDCETPIMHQPCQIGSIQIGAGAWLGAKVTVKRDVRIGAGAIVGANAVVTRDLPDRAIALGIPARVNGFRKADSLTESTASVNASADRLQVP